MSFGLFVMVTPALKISSRMLSATLTDGWVNLLLAGHEYLRYLSKVRVRLL